MRSIYDLLAEVAADASRNIGCLTATYRNSKFCEDHYKLWMGERMTEDNPELMALMLHNIPAVILTRSVAGASPYPFMVAYSPNHDDVDRCVELAMVYAVGDDYDHASGWRSIDHVEPEKADLMVYRHGADVYTLRTLFINNRPRLLNEFDGEIRQNMSRVRRYKDALHRKLLADGYCGSDTHGHCVGCLVRIEFGAERCGQCQDALHRKTETNNDE